MRRCDCTKTATVIRQLEALGGSSDHLIPLTLNAMKMAWKRAVRPAQLPDLRFHDLRHEAVSRFFELGLNVPVVALISGHRVPRMLFRYTHPKAQIIAAKLAGVDPCSRPAAAATDDNGPKPVPMSTCP
ncbi:tyrosine-type recombinase/integrase [Methylobacterium sp. BE186]|uniref:tyrosine-type recombinase/integrase n=1 Tax=Methylobacterium sp. BE186 TaxID=2817715 RepID=UPI00286BACED|nr:tyrosine-type recombinase/integrase [Methylobacterium sp. BE186]